MLLPDMDNALSFQHSGRSRRRRQNTAPVSPASSSALNLLLDVPDSFFAFTFPMLGILLSVSKNFARIRMEELAWEQRLEEGRAGQLLRDPTLTELVLRRREAAQEWSAYGVPRRQEEEAKQEAAASMKRRGGGAAVMDRDDDWNGRRGPDQKTSASDYCMTDEEIEAFELEYGVKYDPHYDDPYSADELPDGKYSVDRMYGDRIYDNGEIFYRDSESGLYYRQGSKPRNFSFFG
jgi:hypothetical protein